MAKQKAKNLPPTSSKPKVESGKKVHGAPLQKLYQDFIQLKQAPSPSDLLQALLQNLKARKVDYHPRTLKRQLSGEIETIPEVLEKALIGWINRRSILGSKSLIKNFEKDKKALQNDEPNANPIGKKPLKDSTQSKKPAASPVANNALLPLFDAYFLKFAGQNRRTLATKLQKKLKAQGYDYQLSSVQALFEDKAPKIRQAALDAVRDFFQEQGAEPTAPAAKPKKSEAVAPRNDSTLESEAESSLHQYTIAEDMPQIVDELLEKYPDLTRRRLAMILKRDLEEKKFEFSLNTLQYILAGKTKKIRRAVAETLKSYRDTVNFHIAWNKVEDVAAISKKGRPSIHKKLLEVFEKLNTTNNEKSRESLQQLFLETRMELIKKRYSSKSQKQDKGPSKARSMEEIYDEIEEQDTSFSESSSSEDLYVSYAINSNLDRLVS